MHIFQEILAKTVKKRRENAFLFSKLNNFLRILYVDQHIFTTLIDLRCFPLFLNKFLSRISRKKTFSRQKSYFFGKNCEKTTPKRSVFGKKKISAHFLCFLLCFHHFDGSDVSSAFSAQIPQNVPFMRQKTYFFGKNCEKTTRKSSFFSNKKLFGTFSMISSMFLPLWVIWGEETEYSKR